MRWAMWLDAGVLVLIVFLAGFGARAGHAAAGIRLVSLPVAYGGALLCAWAFGPALAREAGWSDMAGGLLTGTLGFVGVQALLWLATRAVRRRAESPPPASQALGALFGALRGALYALPFLWLAGLAEGARMAGVRPELPDLSMAQLPAVGGTGDRRRRAARPRREGGRAAASGSTSRASPARPWRGSSS